MAAMTVVWVAPESGVDVACISADLLALGFQIVPSSSEEASSVSADMRILSCAGFPNIRAILLEYRSDERPTLVLVNSAAQEHEVLQFIRTLDDIGRSDATARIIGARLAKLTDRYHANQQIRESARVDALTMLPNRRAMEHAVREAAASARAGECWAALMLDLDHFKSVNDRLGHAAGDVVIIETARRLLEHRQPREFLARYGGEEFVFLLTGKTKDSVHEAAERIIESIRATAFHVHGMSLAITVSGGLAYFEADYSLPAILRNADQALYEAKTLGRDMLVVFSKSAFRRATEDALTGLYNKGTFGPKLIVEMRHAEQSESPLTIALCDLDDFGEINKRIGFGMPAGDAALKRFAEIATECIRSTDWAARIGGDEFCLVMPNTTLEAGAAVAERVRAAVALAEICGPNDARFSITVSLGVLQWSSSRGDTDKLLQKASDAVNAAKSAGGNRVVAVRPEGNA